VDDGHRPTREYRMAGQRAGLRHLMSGDGTSPKRRPSVAVTP